MSVWEVLWLFFTGLGLGVSLVVLDTSVMNYRLLRALGINSLRLYMTATEMAKNLLRTLVQAIFFAVGVWAATQPNPPQTTTAQKIVSLAFITAAGLLTLSTLIDFVRFQRVLRYFNGNAPLEEEG